MSFFPKIKFVDEIPLDFTLSDEAKAAIVKGGVVSGVFTYDNNLIRVLKYGKKIMVFRTLLHELCHWFAYKILRVGHRGWMHKFIDRKWRKRL